MTAPRGIGGRPPLLPAEVVDWIHDMAVDGLTTREIYETLNAAEVPTPSGGDEWTRAHVWRQLRSARFNRLAAAA